jgi:hypothetical protein
MMEHNNLLRETRWIGSISWKAHTKANIDLIGKMVTDESVEADVLAFWEVMIDPLWQSTDQYHPGLMDLLVYILESMGESQDQIQRMRYNAPAFKSFYGSFFVTRPMHMKTYIQWLGKVLHFIHTDIKAQNMIWRDSKYEGDPTIARQVFDLEYYPMHPFVGERLVQYFFNTRNYTIMTACEYRDVTGLDTYCRIPE